MFEHAEISNLNRFCDVIEIGTEARRRGRLKVSSNELITGALQHVRDFNLGASKRKQQIRRNSARLYHTRKSKRLCVQCGKRLTETDTVYCRECRAKMNRYKQKYLRR